MKSLIRSLLLAVVMTIIGPPLAMFVNASFISGEAYASGHRHHHKRYSSHGGFIRGYNICGINTARWRRSHGLRVPRYFAKASEWLHLPHSYSHFGAVMVVLRTHGRGHDHVSPVLGNGICHDPSSAHQNWRDVPCDAIWRGLRRVYVN